MSKPLKTHPTPTWHDVCNAPRQDGQPARAAKDAKMTQPSLFAREDTLLGVCEGLGEEIGVNAQWLRVAFALALFWSPLGAAVAYLTLGVALMLFRWAFPLRQSAATAQPAAVPLADNDDTEQALAEAA
jgi:phage shock protein C